MLDYLSYKYDVLFIVSAGNVTDDLILTVNEAELNSLSPSDRIKECLNAMQNSLGQRRLLSPAESMNSIAVGALHADADTYHVPDRQIDVLHGDIETMISPISRVGLGFREAIKPDLVFAGGRQPYLAPMSAVTTKYSVAQQIRGMGQLVATPNNGLVGTDPCRGTSNATALITRQAEKIYSHLLQYSDVSGASIPNEYYAVLVKTVLVHSAKQPQVLQEKIDNALGTLNWREQRKRWARFMGYGVPNVAELLTGAQSRATIIAWGQLGEKEVHEYRLPLPVALINTKSKLRLTITAAWFTPLNVRNGDLRAAKIYVKPAENNWSAQDIPLEGEYLEPNQIERGTVFNQVFVPKRVNHKHEEGDEIVLNVTCVSDAISHLDERIRYGFAVTLSSADSIDIYTEIKQKIQNQIQLPQKIKI